jgi:hypothetical protein
MHLLRDHGPLLNLVSDNAFSTGTDGPLKPYDSLIDPMVVMRRIGLCLLTTDRSLNQALLSLIHHVSGRLGSNQASVTALSMMCR